MGENIKNKKICITFAGVVGSSKTPITNYLSTKLILPVLNNDALRSEVIEDLGKFNENEYLKRRDRMIKENIENEISFIYDASVDRKWKELKEVLATNNYYYFIISLDLSKELLINLYQAKEYFESLKRVGELLNDHKIFLENYSSDIGLSISDNDFKNRCQTSYQKTAEWIKAISKI